MPSTANDETPSQLYWRHKRRKQLVYERIWVLISRPMVQPCAFCSPKQRKVTATVISHSTDTTSYPICHKCLSTLSLKRERFELAVGKLRQVRPR